MESPSPKRILVLNPRESGLNGMRFLLQLTGCEVLSVRDAEEAVNWITQCGETGFDMLIIDDFTEVVELKSLLSYFESFGIGLPLLIADRQDRREILTGVMEKFREIPIVVCRPDEIIMRLADLLCSRQESNGGI